MTEEAPPPRVVTSIAADTAPLVEGTALTPAATTHNRSHLRLRVFFWTAATILGAADAWATRNAMNPDGVSYLDMGDAYWRGDWHMAINAYWSPLYSWLLGFALKALKPSAYWEYPAAHLVNFAIYLGALASFEFFMRAFIDDRRRTDKLAPAEGDLALPEWAWWTLGYSLFISTSLVMIGMSLVTPDMCVAAFVYLVCGLLLRVRARAAPLRTFVLLGIALGLAYLAKAVMFPLALVFLAVAAFSSRSLRWAVARACLSGLVFLAVSSPLVIAISRAKGRLTFGDSGRLTYAGCINGVDAWFPGASGRLTCGTGMVEGLDTWFPKVSLGHPVKKIYDAPPTYYFGGPIGGTNPFWYDPSYWQDGITPHFDLEGQVLAIFRVLFNYCRMLLSPFLLLNVTMGLVTLLAIASRPWHCLKTAADWTLLVPCLAALGLYSLVNVEYRYVAPFVCILWLVGFSGIRLVGSTRSRRLIAGVVVAVTVTSAASVAGRTLSDLRVTNGSVYWNAAQALERNGIHRGDKVGMVSNDPLGEGGPFVARLARVEIVTQVNRPDLFWAASPLTQSQVLKAMANSGAKAVLARPGPPQSLVDARWQRLGDTGYYAYVLEGEVR